MNLNVNVNKINESESVSHRPVEDDVEYASDDFEGGESSADLEEDRGKKEKVKVMEKEKGKEKEKEKEKWKDKDTVKGMQAVVAKVLTTVRADEDPKDEKISKEEIDRRKSFEIIRQRWLVSSVEVTASVEPSTANIMDNIMTENALRNDRNAEEKSNKVEEGRETNTTFSEKTEDSDGDGMESSGRGSGRGREDYDEDESNESRSGNEMGYNAGETNMSVSMSMISRQNERGEDENDQVEAGIVLKTSSARYDISNSNSNSNLDSNSQHDSQSQLHNQSQSQYKSQSDSDVNVNNESYTIPHSHSHSQSQSQSYPNSMSNSLPESRINEIRINEIRESGQNPSAFSQSDGLIGMRLLTTIGSSSMVTSVPPPHTSDSVHTMSGTYQNQRTSTTSTYIQSGQQTGSMKGIAGTITQGPGSDMTNINRRSVTFNERESERDGGRLYSDSMRGMDNNYGSGSDNNHRDDNNNRHYNNDDYDNAGHTEATQPSYFNRPPFSHTNPQALHMFHPVSTDYNRPNTIPYRNREVETASNQFIPDNREEKNAPGITMTIQERMQRNMEIEMAGVDANTTRPNTKNQNQTQTQTQTHPVESGQSHTPFELPMVAPSSEELFAQLEMISFAADRRAALANVKAKANSKNSKNKSKPVTATATSATFTSGYVRPTSTESAVNRLEQGTARLNAQFESLQKDVVSLSMRASSNKSNSNRGRVGFGSSGTSRGLNGASADLDRNSNSDRNRDRDSTGRGSQSNIPVSNRKKGVMMYIGANAPRTDEYDGTKEALQSRGLGGVSSRGPGSFKGRASGSGGEVLQGKSGNDGSDGTGPRSRTGTRTGSGSGSRSRSGGRSGGERSRERVKANDNHNGSNHGMEVDGRDHRGRGRDRHNEDEDDNEHENEDESEERFLEDAYPEDRWGQQAMETMQKIVDSGAILSQRVSERDEKRREDETIMLIRSVM